MFFSPHLVFDFSVAIAIMCDATKSFKLASVIIHQLSRDIKLNPGKTNNCLPEGATHALVHFCCCFFAQGEGTVIFKESSHRQSYIQAKDALTHYYSSHSSNWFLLIGTDGRRHWTPNLSFSFLHGCHLTRVFILINHLNYDTKISGKVTESLTFISEQCDIGT